MAAIPALVVQGLSLLGVSAAVAVVAGPIAWLVAKATAGHSSKRWLQTHKGALDRELESDRAALTGEADRQRLLLKRQELMFAREVEAADDYTRLYRRLYPKPRHPDAEWDDARIDIAESIGAFEKGLEDFLRDHSIAISDNVSKLLDRAKTIAASTGFEVGADIGAESYETARRSPSKPVCDGVDELFACMTDAFGAIKQDLRTGSMQSEASAGDNSGT